MVITVIGTGFVGTVSACVYASFGHQVFGIDTDKHKIESLKLAHIPFYEPYLTSMLTKQIQAKNLIFTTNYQEAIPFSDIIIIAVGTPSTKEGAADLSCVFNATTSMAPLIKDRAIIAIKSTVPPGTNVLVENLISKHTSLKFAVASLPEFLKEGCAVNDTINADRVVIGATQKWAIEKLLDLHQPIKATKIVVSPESAQMSKYANNAYLALRITFINQIADLCEKTNANIEEVITVIAKDQRIGSHYWYPGLGYGGSCFPKDVKELAVYAKKIEVKNNLLEAMDLYNQTRINHKLKQFETIVDGFKGKMVAVLGLSFKPNTNDLRFAPSQTVIPYLKKSKAVIKAYDPKSMDEAKKIWPKIFYGDNLMETILEADIVMILIEWDEFKQINFNQMVKRTQPNAWIIDTRNLYDKVKLENLGYRYIGVGNP